MFVLAESSQTMLLTDRSEPRFESHTEGKIRIYSNRVKMGHPKTWGNGGTVKYSKN